MEYISTRNTKKTFSFCDVFLKGLAPDGGLFVPKKIPSLSQNELTKFSTLSYKELAAKLIVKFCGNEFSEIEIQNLVNNSYKDFRAKDVVTISKLEKINLLELFHGPTLSFKDIAMQIIGNMYEKILEKNNKKINVVVATSGDTGAAAAAAIKDRKNMKIFVLHPENKISEIQRKFMTTINSKNLFNISISGNFDDCQDFVKLMFADSNFSNKINMSGVNSINWARIVFQTIYYFFCYFKISNQSEKINFSVPTGNFGDIYAGYIAKKMGLPINKLLIATNKNDILKRTINSGYYKPLKVQHTLSPSMDIQIASNFERLIFDVMECNPEKTLELMNNLNTKGQFKIEDKELKKINGIFCSESLSEEETVFTINKVYKNHKILIDPHTAVGIGVMEKILPKGKNVVLATAHPSKFSDVVTRSTSIKPELPENLKSILIKNEKYDILDKDLKKIKSYILDRI